MRLCAFAVKEIKSFKLLCHTVSGAFRVIISFVRFEFIVAFRYLKAKRKQAVVSLITLISVIGVTAGVAALVIALAINAGFRQDLEEKLLGTQAHITLLRPTREGIPNYIEISRRAESVAGVNAAAPALYQQVLLTNGFQSRPAYMKGIVPELEAKRSEVFETLIEGSPEDFGPRSILIGEELALAMGSFVGDSVRALSAETILTPAGPAPRSRSFEVSGVFRSGLYDFDAGYVYVPMEAAQLLLGAGDMASSIEVRIDDIDQSGVLGPEIAAAAGEGLEFTDWRAQNSAIFEALQLERIVMFITIGLIVFVASLNIVVTLVMMVMEKTRDIAVLMSMGATPDNIRRVFIAQGVIIGVVGTGLGLVIGNLVSYMADRYQWVSISQDVYSIAYVPFQTSAADSAIVAVAAVAISYAATLYPSRAASKLQPVEALRYE